MLIQAHIANAAILVIAIPDTLHVRQMVEIARALNPHIEIVVRSHSEEESALLRADQVGTVVVRDDALTQAMTRHILQRFEADPASASAPCRRARSTEGGGLARIQGSTGSGRTSRTGSFASLLTSLRDSPVRRFTAQPCKYDIWLTVLPVRLCIALP